MNTEKVLELLNSEKMMKDSEKCGDVLVKELDNLSPPDELDQYRYGLLVALDVSTSILGAVLTGLQEDFGIDVAGMCKRGIEEKIEAHLADKKAKRNIQ